jgi:hypothetical protein
VRNATTTLTAKLTRRNALWFLRTNVQSWVLQGALVGLLTLTGVGAVAAVVSAKVTAYVVFVGQCVMKAKA